MSDQVLRYNRPPGSMDQAKSVVPPSSLTLTQVTVTFVIALVLTVAFNGL